MEIIVTTKNQGKLGAAQAALAASDFIPGSFKLEGVKVESDVSDTPTSDEEGIQGCYNRISNAEKIITTEPSLLIALEGVVANVSGAWFIRGWTVVKDMETDRMAVASGASTPIPPFISDRISGDDQLSDLVKEAYGTTEEEAAVIRDVGANGVFNQGAYTRHDTFFDGISIAISMLNNDRNWPDQQA